MRKLMTASFVVFVLLALACTAINFSEAYRAANTPHDYHFGSEAMVGEGGDHYRSQQAYVDHCKMMGFFSVAILIVLTWFGYFALRRKPVH